MKRVSLKTLAISLSIFLAATMGLAPSVSAAPQYSKLTIKQGIRHRLYNGTSTNWAGYAVESNLANPQSNAVSDAYGEWTVPTLSCSFRATAYSASWVGIDGYADNTVEQTGTEHDCSRGRPHYYAWFEFYPQYMYSVGLPVAAGNHMSADVSYSSQTNEFTLTLTNMTLHQVFTISSVAPGAARQSAEWITEAPSSWFGVLPLANFNSETFTNTKTTINNVTGPINYVVKNAQVWQYDPVSMVVSQNGPAKAFLSNLINNNSFTVTWNHN